MAIPTQQILEVVHLVRGGKQRERERVLVGDYRTEHARDTRQGYGRKQMQCEQTIINIDNNKSFSKFSKRNASHRTMSHAY